MSNPQKATVAGDEVVAMMAELAGRWPVLSGGEKRRTLEEYAPRMVEMLARQSAPLAEEMPAGG